MINTARRSVSVVVMLAAESAALAALVRIGSAAPYAIPADHLQLWLRTTAPGDALVAGLRVVSLVAAGWILVTTALYAIASVLRLPAAVRATRWATVPAVRRLVDAALVATVAGAATLAPLSGAAQAADAPPSVSTTGAVAQVRDGRSGGVASLPAEPAPSPPSSTLAPDLQRAVDALPDTAGPITTGPTTPTVPAPPVTSAAADAPSSPPSPSTTAGSGSVVVEPGDNLWELAAAALARATGRERAAIGDSEIAPYWAAVCTSNRATLVSGDPNLIYAGEVVTLPPVN